LTEIAKIVSVNNILGEIERKIVACFLLDGRASFREIANALDLSERTISRHGQELLNSGAIQVVGIIERSAFDRKASMVLSISCAPGTTTLVATALANLSESIFVYVTTGNNNCLTEIFGEKDDLRNLLFNVIPGIPGVNSVVWNAGILSIKEMKGISHELRPRPIQEIDLQAEDLAILDVLAKNGRATYEQISRVSGLSEPTARRKAIRLIDSGAISIHAVIDPKLIGFPVECWIWIKCTPKATRELAEFLVSKNCVRYLTTITGEFQILFEVALPSRKELADFLEKTSEECQGIIELKSQVLLDPFKRSGKKINKSNVS
jgi:DNA-binding Lrp family transcriptional regulator